MNDAKEWMWLVKTPKGDFFITVLGNWSQENAAKRVRGVFEIILKLEIISMATRKRATGPIDMACTIIEQQPLEDEVGFDFLAGKGVWYACGKSAEYDVQRILLDKELERV